MFTCFRMGEDPKRPAALVIGLSHEEMRDIIQEGIHRIDLGSSFSIKIMPTRELVMGTAVPRDAELVLFAAKTEQECVMKFAEALPEEARAQFMENFEEDTPEDPS